MRRPAAIAELVRALEDAARDPDDDLVQRETDIRFHRAIAEAAGNRGRRRADGLVLGGPPAAAAGPDRPRRSSRRSRAEQHREIIAAIEQRKPVLAERAMRVHLRYLSDLLETVGPRRAADPHSGLGACAQPRLGACAGRTA